MEKRGLISVFLVSMAVLGAQLGVIRYMSVASWSNFAGLIISIALLGFGLSGTILTVLRERIERRLQDWLFWSAAAFIIAAGYVLQFARLIPFIPQSLHQDGTQVLYLALYYFLFFVPFFFGALFINLSFLRMKTGINRMYLYNLMGSGIGALVLLVCTSVISPQYLMIPVLLLGSAVVINEAIGSARRMRLGAIVMAVAFLPVLLTGIGLFSPATSADAQQCADGPAQGQQTAVSEPNKGIWAGLFNLADINMSHYKDISYALKVPESRVIHEKSSSLGYIQVIESSQFRFAPGLSLSYYDSIPPVQHGLFIDGFGASGIARYVDATNAGYIRYLPFSLSYSLKNKPSALVIGAGGGNPVLFALTLGASKVMAVEPYAPVVDLARETFAAWSKGIWDDPRVTTVISDGRTFCKRDDGKYDILSIPAMVSSGMSFSSGSGNGENYLFTKEAFDDYLSRLAPEGILDVSMRLDSPPRALLKLESLVFSWAKERFPADFAQRIVFIRGLDWGAFLVKNGVFATNEIALLKKKTRDLSADFSYYPGISASEVNQYNVIPEEVYYAFAQAFVAGTEQAFIGGYAFNIEPPTDNRPYFSHFLPLSTVPKLLGLSGGMKDVPFDEWGYLLSWATVLQGVVFGLLIICIPVFTSGRAFLRERGKLRVIVYFFALGMGFMLIEIAVIQKLNLFIANPLYSVALVIGVLLIFSGIGAGFASRYRGEEAKKGITVGVSGILAALALHAFVFAPLMQPLLALHELLRIMIVILFLAPLGFFMGFPFPLGLQVLSDKREKLMPWGLAINGSVSVFASVLTSILSMHFGFAFVIFLAALFYVAAWVTFPARIRFSS